MLVANDDDMDIWNAEGLSREVLGVALPFESSAGGTAANPATKEGRWVRGRLTGKHTLVGTTLTDVPATTTCHKDMELPSSF